ncbi:MAG: hypothetical protein J6N78_04625 [Clostridia bacterium]|nr:hypothetical protein [Clostridia bacterium]
MKPVQQTFKIKGMQTDLDTNVPNSDYASYLKNIRISRTNKLNNLYALTNIQLGNLLVNKGTDTSKRNTALIAKWLNLYSYYIIGDCYIGEHLVLFIYFKKPFTEKDKDGKIIQEIIIRGDLVERQLDGSFALIYSGNSYGWKETTRVQCIPYYENTEVQKIYCTTNDNKYPFYFNSADLSDSENFYQKSLFTSELSLNEEVSIYKDVNGYGQFAGGTVQYIFTYALRYGKESAAFYTSCLFYPTDPDKGISPESNVSNTFKIKISNVENDKWDLIKVYSLQRTSQDTAPIAKHVADISINSNVDEYTITDNGLIGETIDPTLLLYLSGNKIKVGTLCQKDNVLFMGDIEIVNDNNPEIEESSVVTYAYATTDINLSTVPNDDYYRSDFQLNQRSDKIKSFKGNERYRFGVQMQDKYGTWSDVVYIGDKTNLIYPKIDDNNILQRVIAKSTVKVKGNEYKKIRPVIVFPSLSERRVITQGIINPTIVNLEERDSNTMWCQSSWFNRPIHNNSYNTSDEWSYLKNTDGSIIEKDFFKCTIELYDAGIIGNSNNIRKFMAYIDIPLIIDGNTNNYHYTLYTWSYDDSLGGAEAQFREDFSKKFSKNIGDTVNVYQVYNGSGYIVELLNGSIYMHIKRGITGSNYFIDTTSSPNATYNVIDEQVYYVEDEKGYADSFLLEEGFYGDNDIYYFTIYNLNGKSVLRYAQKLTDSEGSTVNKNSLLKNNHLNSVHNNGLRNEAELSPILHDATDNDLVNKNLFKKDYRINWNCITINSPESELDTEFMLNQSFSNCKFRVVGESQIQSSYSKYTINADNLAYTETGVVNNTYLNNYSSKSAKSLRLTSWYIWKDKLKEKDKAIQNDYSYFKIRPFHTEGSISHVEQNDNFSNLKKKILSNLYFCNKTVYYSTIQIQESDLFFNPLKDLYLDSGTVLNVENLFSSLVNIQNDGIYFFNPTTDSILLNDNHVYGGNYNMYKSYNSRIEYSTDINGISKYSQDRTNSLTHVSYKSTPHFIVQLPINENVYTLLYSSNANLGPVDDTNHLLTEEWDYKYQIKLNSNIFNNTVSKFFIGEIYKDIADEDFMGGNSEAILESHLWLPCGEPVTINNGEAVVKWTEGDTYIQRYDCLKTYAYSQDDTNQINDIVSFLVETRINLDGRYDKNKGLKDNTIVTRETFNKVNTAYTQNNNFFTYTHFNEGNLRLQNYPNGYIWTNTKIPGTITDVWTKPNIATLRYVDGTYGNRITALINYRNNILAFQDSGISLIHFNERTSITDQQGLPLELASSNKVTGSEYLSTSYGSSNYFNICQTPTSGSLLYFVSDLMPGIYCMNGSAIENISKSKSIQSFINNKLNSNISYSYHTFYDKYNNEVLFTSLGEEKRNVLVYNENLGAFSGEYDYNINNTKYYNYFFSDNHGFYRHEQDTANLYALEQGNYLPCTISFIANVGAAKDVIYDSIDYRHELYYTVTEEDENGNKENKEILIDDTFTNLSIFTPLKESKASYKITSKFNKDLTLFGGSKNYDVRKGIMNYYADTKRGIVYVNEYGEIIGNRLLKAKKRFNSWHLPLPRLALYGKKRRQRVRYNWAEITLDLNHDDVSFVENENEQVEISGASLNGRLVLHDINVNAFIN